MIVADQFVLKFADGTRKTTSFSPDLKLEDVIEKACDMRGTKVSIDF